MDKRTFKTLAAGVLALSSLCSLQALAAPSFTFTEYGGFTDDVAVADYSGLVVGPASAVPAATPIYSKMAWNSGASPQSSLVLNTVTGPSGIAADTWTTISTLTHNNVLIPGAVNWGPQDIWGRFVLTDSDGGSSVVLDSDEAISISLTETPNTTCAPPNPVGTTCDDFFTFTIGGLASLFFDANDGSKWRADFGLGNLVNAVQIGATVYTGEARSSSLDVLVKLTMLEDTEVPEPGMMGLMGLGLLGLGMYHRRRMSSY